LSFSFLVQYGCMIKIIIFIIAVVTGITAVGAYRYNVQTKQTRIACTMDAKLCPDGSYVGRTGPNCEFAVCPGGSPVTSSGTGGVSPNGSGIRGTVTLGPTCPVERIPSYPHCADRPYQTSVTIFRASDPAHAFLVTKSDAGGTFEVSLPPGEYTLSAGAGKLPGCNHPRITVEPNTMVPATISCDTGIR
jgi:hypothetical protein